MLSGQLALTTAAVFTGAAIYINVAEQPARLQLDDRSILAEWKPAYKRGYMMQASLAVAGGLFGFVAYFNAPDWRCGVDPVWWTPFQLRRRCHRCRRVTDPMRRNSGDRWLLWSDLGEHRRSCRASSNRPPRRSGTGFVRLIAMKAADRTARPAPSARS